MYYKTINTTLATYQQFFIARFRTLVPERLYSKNSNKQPEVCVTDFRYLISNFGNRSVGKKSRNAQRERGPRLAVPHLNRRRLQTELPSDFTFFELVSGDETVTKCWPIQAMDKVPNERWKPTSLG